MKIGLIFWFYSFAFVRKVFTWYGATIEMDGSTETDYAADEVFVCLFVKNEYYQFSSV